MQPFSPHPRWREHFPYQPQFAPLDLKFRTDPTFAAIRPTALAFQPDPVINRYSAPPPRHASQRVS